MWSHGQGSTNGDPSDRGCWAYLLANRNRALSSYWTVKSAPLPSSSAHVCRRHVYVYYFFDPSQIIINDQHPPRTVFDAFRLAA